MTSLRCPECPYDFLLNDVIVNYCTTPPKVHFDFKCPNCGFRVRITGIKIETPAFERYSLESVEIEE